jgi:hypothetical protein
MPNSIACKYEDFSQLWYRRQEKNLKIREIFDCHSAAKVDFVNRKFWEWCAICEALETRSFLTPGVKGLGFAVGTEPLVSYFAAKGCQLIATDLHSDLTNQGWIETNEHASSLNNIFYEQLIDRNTFEEKVSFIPADMRDIEGVGDDFDFIWSSCALEHLGTLQHGLDFVINSSKLLRKGGLAVHTTEFNVESGLHTVESGPNVIYRKKDLVYLDSLLEAEGFLLHALNFDTGSHQYDLDYDEEPYMMPGKRHLKLKIDKYIATSFLLVVQRL